MPVNHIVFWKLRADVSEEKMKNLEEGLRSLEKIDGVISVSFGRNFTKRAPYDYVLNVIMKDKATLEKYNDDPIHVRVKNECIIPVREDLGALDFEF